MELSPKTIVTDWGFHVISARSLLGQKLSDVGDRDSHQTSWLEWVAVRNPNLLARAEYHLVTSPLDGIIDQWTRRPPPRGEVQMEVIYAIPHHVHIDMVSARRFLDG